MLISVGSKNPVKVNAVENVVRKVWPDAEVISVETLSGVKEQPTSDEEAIEGAGNRARLALKETGADLGIGLEGCTVESKHGLLMSGWAVVIDTQGVTGIGGGGRMVLPSRIASEVRKGKELGLVMDEIVGGTNTKQKQGVSGILTNNILTRTQALESQVAYAVARFINQDYYK